MRPVLLAFFALVGSLSLANAEEFPLLVTEDFSQGVARWHFSDPPETKPTWKIVTDFETASGNPVLRSQGGSKYLPQHRSPLNFALLKEPVVSDFELTVRVQNTNFDAGPHRDLCVFWGYQDPDHFYYVHLGSRPDPHSCQVFLVNAADRVKITEKESPGTPWDREWHTVRVARNTASGGIEVFFDDLDQPVMTAHDKTFTWGRVGIGTFDDNGNFDDLQLRGAIIEPVPTEARLPGE